MGWWGGRVDGGVAGGAMVKLTGWRGSGVVGMVVVAGRLPLRRTQLLAAAVAEAGDALEARWVAEAGLGLVAALVKKALGLGLHHTTLDDG